VALVSAEARMPVAVWSDYICPFCNVARERVSWLRREAGAEVTWHPFDLHPEYPPEGIPRAALEARYGERFSGVVRELTEEAGLPYAPHAERVPRSRRALELSEWARAEGGEEAHERLHERIMDAYWAAGRDISDWDVLAECARAADLDADAGREAVDAGAYAAPVDTSTEWAQRHGIMAVPAFVLDGRLLVSGAVPHEALGRAVERARAMRAERG
jgi:predicted DsbA family dithiol-disulfide isomerase